MKRFVDFLGGLPMTIVAGVFLAISLGGILLRVDLAVDPAWVTVVISGIPMLYLALTRLFFQRWISSALLISIAMAASLWIGEIFAAGEVAFIMAIGAILEDKTILRAKQGLSALIALSPTQARKICEDGREEYLAIEAVRVGDRLRVLAGEKIPVDGIIRSGETAIDQSIITGESLPVDKAEGDEVFCGTVNAYGVIEIEAGKVGEDSSLQKLIRLVQEAEEKKAPMQRLADKWAVWLVPIALLIAIATFFVNRFMGNELLVSLNRCVTVLVVFCPCALALATPVSIVAAIGQATKHGVIIKSGEALENMGRIETIAFDKTGTLSYGRLTVSDVISFDHRKEKELLQLLASAERKSEHPLGKAIVRHAVERELELFECDRFVLKAGRGIEATVDGKSLLAGNERFFEENDVALSDEMKLAVQALSGDGKAIVLLAVDGSCIGLVALLDAMRENAGATVEMLSSIGTEAVLLTGDNERAARYLADRLGIKRVFSELLPQQKVEKIAVLQQNGRVCMVGDGVNDAPALKLADVGVAMGTIGSDIAIETADIALMGDDISKILYLKKLSDATLRTIQFNLSLSMVINFVAVAMSTMGLLNPVTGALVHNAGSVFVVLNAALLYDRKF